MTIITISRQYGSGGDEIAYRLSKDLNYRFFDKFMVMEAAKEAGLSDQDAASQVVDYSEDSHQVRSFIERLFERVPVMPYNGIWPEDYSVQYTMEEERLKKENSLKLVQKAILTAYQTGNFVIVGRGGQVLLKDKPDVIHARIVAPAEVRTRVIKERLKGSEHAYSANLDHRYEVQAWEVIQQRDAASADYIKRFYQADWSDPLLYHCILNTGIISTVDAAQMIIKLVDLYKKN